MRPMTGPTGVEQLTAARVIAVIRSRTMQGAISTADAIIEGGIRAVEITYSTPETPRVIAELRGRHADGVLIGAGTVRRAAEVGPAVDSGAQFIVSPGVDDQVIEEARGRAVAVIPGALTPTEIMRAVALGADAVKLFPALFGGPSLLRALREPFPEVGFVPTGGVTTGNLGEWFAAGAIAVAAGGSLCPRSDIASGRFDAIRERAARFTSAAAAHP
ncbi:MAG: bifunctional 4-hydroxy-2-oxoglutarate aldolase/2-dehydro-3-deoxy-phosphogluconate aldolase, partial [Solirubrobacterales bacterium]|nr:bifunctional 4-hydroxy-2-oxoglutarate aldolase/2-dehydro-3-deoxy-phosphogluconate aldolase [Solirubrobacterales bacterium]